MITVLTICSANYLAHAKTLGDSLREHNPDFEFVIGLVDRIPKELSSSFWSPYELMPVEDLGIPAFAEMARKYNIVELNTAVKPFYMERLYQRNSKVEAVIYLDPDILVCANFDVLVNKLRSSNIIVTPHSCSSDDSNETIFYQTAMLSTGVYNLGFVATSRSDTTFTFLKWWQKRLQDYCYYRAGTGLFVDQLWVTLVPLYFDGVLIEKDPGYNMCYWNHFERHLSNKGGRYLVNQKHDLIFYHFSSYNPKKPHSIATRQGGPVFSFVDRPDLKSIYDKYRELLLCKEYDLISSFRCCFGRQPSKPAARTVLREALREILTVMPSGIQKPVKNVARWMRGNRPNEVVGVNPYIRNV